MPCLRQNNPVKRKLNGYGPVCYQNIFGKDPQEKRDKKLQLDGQISVVDLITENKWREKA